MSSSDEEMPSEHPAEKKTAFLDSDDAASPPHNFDEEPARYQIDYEPSDSDEEIEKEREAARLKALQEQQQPDHPMSPPQQAIDSDDDLPSERHNSDDDLPSERHNSDDDLPSERHNSDAEHDNLSDNRGSDDDRERREEMEEGKEDAESPKETDHKQIFGDMSDSDEDEKPSAGAQKRDFTEEDIVGPRLYPDPEEQQVQQPGLPDKSQEAMNVITNRTTADLGKEGPLFVKFPNFLSVETKPFEADYYEDEVDDDEGLDEEGRQRVKLKVENTIRWRTRTDDEGNEIRESNSKIVKWSDGTMSLHLGNEVFDVTPFPMHEHNHLFIRQGAGLQGLSVFKKRVVFRPSSTETLTHRKMTLNMAERSSKSQKVKVLNIVGNNPEEAKRDMIRKEEEKLRAAARRETVQRKLKDRQRAGGISSQFLEGEGGYDSDEGDISVGAIKNRYKPRPGDKPLLGQSSDEDSDHGRRLDNAKIDSDESDVGLDTKKEKLQPTSRRKIDSDEDSD